MKKKSLASSLIQQYDKDLKSQILSSKVSKDAFHKFSEEQKKSSVKGLSDLLNIKTKSESEVYDILNTMVKNSQFFMYCGPLLLNINPGPNNVKDYLNLQTWVKDTSGIDEEEWKPHLYTFIYSVYKILIQENKDQVVNMLGQIGSGKTFNMIHIIEYFCCMVGPENKQIETFDMIHKSIQLVHIMGSIFRQNNLESTSCGILLRLGFGNDNKISNFDIDAKILDCTLPFSENGRSYSILHSFLSAATSELKKNFFLPETEVHLNFFKKFGKNFSKSTKEKFKLNDFEIWNRFHNLLKYFDFTKNEVIEILQILSFLININELGMIKGGKGNKSGFQISKGHYSHRLSILLSMNEDNFIHQMGLFKDVLDIKNTFISLMKYSYYIAFEYILLKIKNKLRIYFNGINGKNLSKTKYINFLDFPGEVEDQTLGGLLTNLANECINLYAGNSYSSVVEKLHQEQINLKMFPSLHSYQVVNALMGQNGLFSHLSHSFTESNFKSMLNLSQTKLSWKKCVKFVESERIEDQFKFDFKFSHTKVRYNYQSLYAETKSIINCKKILKIFSLSNNKIIKSMFAKVIPTKIDFFTYTSNLIKFFFTPIEGLSPFIIYCLHSNNSRKLFFGNDNYITDQKWVIPNKLTEEMLKNSLCIPVLYWQWFGYHEWIDIETFLLEFEEEYLMMEERKRVKMKPKGKNEVEEVSDKNFKDLSNYEKVDKIINSFELGKDCIIGKTKILFKSGGLLNLRKKFDKIMDTLTKSSKRSKGGSKNVTPAPQSQLNNLLRKNTNSNININNNTFGNSRSSRRNKDNLAQKNLCELFYIQSKNAEDPKVPQSRKIIELINEGENSLSKKYNIFNIMDSSKSKEKVPDSISSGDEKEVDKFTLGKNEEEEKKYNEYKSNNNIILPSQKNFNMFNNLLNVNKKTNFKIFDYSKFLPEIIKIQCAFRSFCARQRKLYLKYLISRICTIQKFVKGMQTRHKFKRLQKCLKYIIKIQRTFRSWIKKLRNNVTKIQATFRKYLAKKKFNRKTKRLKQKEEEYYDSSDEEQVKSVKAKKKQKEDLKMLEQKIKQRESSKRKEKERIKIKRKEEEEEKRRQIERTFELQKKLFMKKRDKIRRKNNPANSFYSYFKDEPQPKNKNKSFIDLRPKQAKKKDEIYHIEYEKNPERVITALLLDKNLMKEKKDINRLLANENGVKRDIKYKLLQIETPKIVDKKDMSFYKKEEIKEKKGNDTSKRIEDKLIEYGKILKQKKAKEKVDKLKEEDEKCTFKPSIKKKKDWIKNYSKDDFYKRAAQFEEKKEKDLDLIKNSMKDPHLEEYTFHPKISKNSQKIKRNIKDLLNWNDDKIAKIESKKQEKLRKEAEEIELKRQNTTLINNKSKILLNKKSKTCANLFGNNNTSNYISDIDNNNLMDNIPFTENYQIEFDLWPSNFEKKYYDDKFKIPYPKKKNLFNHLDYIYNNRKKEEEYKINEKFDDGSRYENNFEEEEEL